MADAADNMVAGERMETLLIALEEAVDSLPPRHFRCLMERVAGWSFTEIALRGGVSRQNARNVVCRAKVMIRRRLGGRYERPVSAQQVEILRLVALGLTDIQIADKVCLSVRTVHSYLREAYARLHVKNRIQAVNALRESRLL